MDVVPDVAVMVAVVLVPTVDVLTVKAIDVLPAGIVTVPGTVATDWLLESEMTRPPLGATEPMVTVPVDVLPPTTDAGLSFNEDKEGGLTVRVALWVLPFRLAVMVTAV